MLCLQVLIGSLLVLPFIAFGSECPLPSFKEEAKSVLKIFGFSDSCSQTALDWCDRGCGKDFPSAIRASEESILEAASALEKALTNLRSLSGCLKKEEISVEKETTTNASQIKPRNCGEIKQSGDAVSGMRTIYPFSCCPEKPVSVYCDQSVDGGGWTVIQRRENLPVREDFYRNWTEYAHGFGNLSGEFWLGLDNIHEITSFTTMTLRIEMENEQGERRYAHYDDFKVGNASTKYQLISVGKYTGDAEDSLSGHANYKFSTHDQDNDSYSPSNCAAAYKGGWWYSACHSSNLNGFQYVGETTSYADGIVWKNWLGYHYSLSRVVMMIRPSSTN